MNAAEAGIKPPWPPKALLSVPLMMRLSLSFSPKCSKVPRPFEPSTPTAWASSSHRIPGRVDPVPDAEMGGFVDKGQVKLIGQALGHHQPVEVSADIIERLLGPEVAGDLLLGVEENRVIPDPGAGGGAVV